MAKTSRKSSERDIGQSLDLDGAGAMRENVDGFSIDEALKSVLSSSAHEEEQWAERAKTGATDVEIRQAVTFQIGPPGRSSSRAGICKLATKPKLAFYFGNYGGGGVAPTLEGEELVRKIREVMGVGEPGPAKSMFAKSLRYASDEDLERSLFTDELSEAHRAELVSEISRRRIEADAKAGRDAEAGQDGAIATVAGTKVKAYFDPGTSDLYLRGPSGQVIATGVGEATEFYPQVDWADELARAIEARRPKEVEPVEIEEQEPISEETGKLIDALSDEPTHVAFLDGSVVTLNEAIELQGMQFQFDFGGVADDDARVIKIRTIEIQQRVNRIQEYTIEIGDALRDVRRRVETGRWGEYLKSETPFSEDTAGRLIAVADYYDANPQFAGSIGQFDKSAQYLLVKASTPEAAREEMIERAEAGQPITHAAAKDIVDRHKAAEEVAPEEFEAGVCAICKCTALTPCVVDEEAGETCAWADEQQNLCTRCVLEAEAGGIEAGVIEETKRVEAEPVATGRTLEDLLSLLKATPDGMQTSDLVKRDFSPKIIEHAQQSRLIDRTTGGKCTYAWTPADVVEAIKAEGPMGLVDLEQMGCKRYAVIAAKSDGLIEQKGSKWTIVTTPEGKPATARSATKAKAASSAAPASTKPVEKSGSRIEDLLRGRQLNINFSWLPQIRGKVTVGVCVGTDRTKTKYQTFDASAVRGFSDAVQVMIVEALSGGPVASKTQGKGKTGDRKPATAKKSKSAPTPAQKAAYRKQQLAKKRKPAGKPAAKKKARKR